MKLMAGDADIAGTDQKIGTPSRPPDIGASRTGRRATCGELPVLAASVTPITRALISWRRPAAAARERHERCAR
jgi:hypothetical protein